STKRSKVMSCASVESQYLVGCPYREFHPEWLAAADRVICCGMIDSLKLLAGFVVSLFRSKAGLEAEIVILRHQLNVLRRRMPSRARLTLIDRLIFVWLYRLRPSVLSAVVIILPETVVPAENFIRSGLPPRIG
ncbi:MAG: hypothetical protein ACLQJR_21575, partial [Stellaceae bacterium]